MNSIERREFLKLTLGAISLAALSPREMFAQTATDVDKETQPFLWTREEILFGENAGFEDARAGIPLGVYTSNGIQPTIVDTGITAWNRLASQLGRNDLFYNEEAPSKAKIVVVSSFRNRVTAYPDYQSPFEWCHIELYIRLPNIVTAEILKLVAHELGHTLGFVDFVSRTKSLEGLVNPQRYDLPDKPIRSIMAENSRWFGEDDPKMLKLAGYV